MERIVEAARFVRRLEATAHRGEVWDLLKEVAADRGFTHLTVIETDDVAPAAIVHSDAPAEAADALVAYATKQLEPFATRTMGSVGNDTWVFPVRRAPEGRGAVILAGASPDMSPFTCSILHLVSHLAFAKSAQMQEAPPVADPGLTAREIECLRWVARGKTDAEIAVILSIRPRTARFHIENAKRKLGVAKRVHAVAEALRLRAIAA